MKRVSMKIALANLLTKKHTIPWARHVCSNSTAVANSNVSATNTWYNGSSFTGYSNYYSSNNSEYFVEDTNGVKILRPGVYKVDGSSHINQNGSSLCTLALNVWRWRSGTWSGAGSTIYPQTQNGYASSTITVIMTCEANDVISVRVNRYATGTANSKWRPSYITLSVVLLQDLELDPIS